MSCLKDSWCKISVTQCFQSFSHLFYDKKRTKSINLNQQRSPAVIQLCHKEEATQTAHTQPDKLTIIGETFISIDSFITWYNKWHEKICINAMIKYFHLSFFYSPNEETRSIVPLRIHPISTPYNLLVSQLSHLLHHFASIFMYVFYSILNQMRMVSLLI